MQVSATSNWLPPAVETDIDSLCDQLAHYHGHRTIWLDAACRVWHAEPDEMLEDLGHTYVGTFLRPAVDELAMAVARVMPTQPAPADPATPPPLVTAGELAFA